MSKLDDILDDFGHAVVNNKQAPRTLVRKPAKDAIKALRPGALFCYNN